MIDDVVIDFPRSNCMCTYFMILEGSSQVNSFIHLLINCELLELGSEYGSVHSWKERVKMRNEKDWEEEVSSKSTLKQYKLAKNGVEVFKICAGSQSCEAAVQTEDWFSWFVEG